jgi:hypothetical protein
MKYKGLWKEPLQFGQIALRKLHKLIKISIELFQK